MKYGWGGGEREDGRGRRTEGGAEGGKGESKAERNLKTTGSVDSFNIVYYSNASAINSAMLQRLICSLDGQANYLLVFFIDSLQLLRHYNP